MTQWRTEWQDRKGTMRYWMCAKTNSRVIQQQHNGVELSPGSVISSERHDEVIETVPRGLGWHNDEFVLKSVRFGIHKTVVPAPLHTKKEEKQQHTGIWCIVLLQRRSEKGNDWGGFVIEWLSWRKSNCPPDPVVGSKTGLFQPTDGTKWASSRYMASSEDNL